MLDFCSGITFPAVADNQITYEYDVATNTFVSSGATNIYTLTVALLDANVTIESAENDILDNIDRLSSAVLISDIMKPLGFVEYTASIDAANEFQVKMDKFKADTKKTYCAYRHLYKKSLDRLFASLSKVNDTDLQISVFNAKKVLVVIAIVNRISKYLTEIGYDLTRAQDIKTAIDKNTEEIKAQLGVLQDKSSKTELYKRMVEYTEEKNRAHRNLLSLYSVLNIVGLGLIFYIAKE
jgi:hypothetical protein